MDIHIKTNDYAHPTQKYHLTTFRGQSIKHKVTSSPNVFGNRSTNFAVRLTY